jgi:hypothetical protein
VKLNINGALARSDQKDYQSEDQKSDDNPDIGFISMHSSGSSRVAMSETVRLSNISNSAMSIMPFVETT